MKTRVLTDNYAETLLIRWDGDRFALVQHNPLSSIVIILDTLEMSKLIEFAKDPNKEGT